MKLHLTASTAIASLCFSFLAIGAAEAYTFTKIADTSSVFSSFFKSPAINNEGFVAFGAELEAGGSAIFTSNGTAITTIADTNGMFTNFGDLSINDAGTVAFKAGLEGNRVGIFKSNGSLTTTIALRDVYLNSFVNSPSINNAGTVAYTFDTYSFGGGIRIGDGTTVDYDNSGSGERFSIYGSPALNDVGTLAYFYANPWLGTVIVIEGDSGTTTISGNDTYSMRYPAINNAGFVAFSNGGSEISITNGTATTSVVDSSGPFSYVETQSLNDFGTVAFLAGLDGGGRGIFTGADVLKDKVIATGESLFGSTVVELGFFREGLNNAGQVAFFARLANGTSGIFRADVDTVSQPVPEPSSGLGMVAMGALAAASTLKRKQKHQMHSKS